jgi:hypothetical protein
LPVGLVRLPSQEVILHPHEEVRNRLLLVFNKFEELQAANAVARYCKQAKLLIPVRPAYDHDSTAHEWREPDRQRILCILHNPAYAGAFAYGRQAPDPASSHGPQWQVLIQNHYPSYITWSTFLANREQLKANVANYFRHQSGVARQGKNLLQGILICHHCGLRMRSAYTGPQHYSSYICSRPRIEPGVYPCQRVWASTLDAEVEKLVLAALAPDQLALALAAYEKQEEETTTFTRQWELRLERIHYQTDRVRRQYEQVEPENRLVARSLEGAWEEKLLELETVEREYAAWHQQQLVSKQVIDRKELLAMSENFPALWRSATTSNNDKKEIIRLLMTHVIVEQDRERGKVWFQINWQTGALSQHWYIRSVNNYEAYAYKDALQKRMHELAAAQLSARETADALNEEGFQTARRKCFTTENVNYLRCKWRITSQFKNMNPPDRWPDGSYSVKGAAKKLGISVACLHKRLEQGRHQATQGRKGAAWHIYLTPEEITQHKR